MSLLESGPSSLVPETDLHQDPLSATTHALAASSQTVIAFPYTGDYRIDTLLDGDNQLSGTAALVYRWNALAPLGSPARVSYSFMTAKPVYGGTDDSSGDTGFAPFTDQQKAAAREILAHLQAELGITFTEVADTATSYGQIRFGDNTQATSSGYAWLPNSTGDDRAGDVWIDNSFPQELTNVAPGTDAYANLLHEIGHALGLKHPGNYNAGSAPLAGPGNYLGGAEDSVNYTVMSYTDAAAGQPRDWYGMYDLLALKTLYGSRSFNAGDTTYSFTDADGRVLKLIDDSSGTDTLDLSALTIGGHVDLRPGGFSSVGLVGSVAAVNNLSIDLTTTIENFVGTAHDDTVTGNDANNSFSLGTGANAADGGAGVDTVRYAASLASYQIAKAAGAIHVTGMGAADTLTNVERLSFSDSRLAFDAAGAAGLVAKTLAAVFGPAAVSVPEYVGIGLTQADAGMGYAGLLQLAIDAKLTPQHTNAQVVELLYGNVLGGAPSPAQEAPYVAQLDSGALTQATLGIIAADSAPNIAHIDVVGLSQTGLPYV